MVVLTKYLRKITSGVGQEVNYALGIGLPVFELRGGRFIRQRRPVRHLSLKQTLRLRGYDWPWRFP